MSLNFGSFASFSITDVVNKTNIKRLGYWAIDNKMRAFVIVCMVVTIGYKHYKKMLKPTKWSGQVYGIFKSLKPTGEMEFMVRSSFVGLSITNYAMPRIYEDPKNDDERCQIQLHMYLKTLLQEFFNDAKETKIVFDKNNARGVLSNKHNPGFHSTIVSDGRDLGTTLEKSGVLCNLSSVASSQTKTCDWCAIRDATGLRTVRRQK